MYKISGKQQRTVEVEQKYFQDGTPSHLEIHVEGLTTPLIIISDEEDLVDIFLSADRGINTLDVDAFNKYTFSEEEREDKLKELESSGRLT